MWKIIKEELKELTNTKWKILGLIFLLITPMLYAVLFLSSFSRPIHNFDAANIQIANIDSSSKISSQLKKSMIGSYDIDIHTDKYTMTIKDTPKVYKTQEDAKRAVDNNEIDGIFIIPKDFSSNMVKSITGIVSELTKIKASPSYKPKAITFPKLIFYTSYKNSYVAARFLSMRADVSSLKLEFFDSAINKTIESINANKPIIPLSIKSEINNLYQTNRDEFIKYKSIGGNIGDYGNGLAPYFFSIALWAGGIMSVFMYKNRRIGPHAQKAGTFKNYFSKTIVWVLTGWIQSLLMLAGAFIVGFKMDGNVFHLIIFTMFIATLFSLIIQGISSIFRVGEVGSFMVLILLILQLATSGGIFPVTMQEPFWQKIGPIVPFTYTIDSFREFLVEPNALKIWTNIWPIYIFLLFVPISITINYIADKKRFKKYGHYTSHDPELHNEM